MTKRRTITKVKHPIQPLVKDRDGKARFKQNAIVRYLLDNGGIDIGQIAKIPFDQDDLEQFYQLIGTSLVGFGELEFVSDETYEMAAEQCVHDHHA